MAELNETSAAPKLSPKQQKAIEALMVGASDQQAADTAGVSRNTIRQWRTESGPFARALATARSELLKRTYARVHAATTIAIRALEDIAKDVRYPNARVSAARAILEISNKLVVTEDLERRVEELERDFESDRLAAQESSYQ